MYDEVIRVKSAILVRAIRVNMLIPQAVSFDVSAFRLNLTYTTTSLVARISDLTVPGASQEDSETLGTSLNLAWKCKHWKAILLSVLGPNQLY